MSGLRLREARTEDWEGIAALHAASWQRSYRGIMSDRFLDREVVEERRRHWRGKMASPDCGDLVLLAEDEEGLAGFIAALPDPQDGSGALVDNLHVAGDRQGQGIGRTLLGETAVRLAGAGRRSLHLWVFDANADAVRFYLALGGTAAEHGFEVIEGRPLPHTRVEWRDLRMLASACRR